MVAHNKANGAWGLNNLIWPVGPLLYHNSVLSGSAELQIASTHAQTVACQPILPSLTQLALINAWSLMVMPSQVLAFNAWSLKCLRWMSELLPEMRPVVFFVNFPADPRGCRRIQMKWSTFILIRWAPLRAKGLRCPSLLHAETSDTTT